MLIDVDFYLKNVYTSKVRLEERSQHEIKLLFLSIIWQKALWWLWCCGGKTAQSSILFKDDANVKLAYSSLSMWATHLAAGLLI